ncbi:MAG: hypothetical protein HY737_02080 [Candidatus Omnitrophica bacterium]|nr:hypothetical protein [Candidatus Omnitrophota bacterium]
MPYLIDRGRAVRTTELVAVVRGRQRRIRSQLIFRDNSIYNTLTRPGTLRAVVEQTGTTAGRTTRLVWRAQQP